MAMVRRHTAKIVALLAYDGYGRWQIDPPGGITLPGPGYAVKASKAGF